MTNGLKKHRKFKIFIEMDSTGWFLLSFSLKLKGKSFKEKKLFNSFFFIFVTRIEFRKKNDWLEMIPLLQPHRMTLIEINSIFLILINR